MDFWDLTTLIFRRWKFALPLLLIAAGATAFVALTIRPDYTMTSYVQFVPAYVAPTDNIGNASLRNPWNQLGLTTLGQASIYQTQDQRFLDSLKAARHTDNFTLTMANPNPIVTVEVVGPTQADVRDTTELIITRLRDSARTLQKQSGAQDKDMILTQRLDQGQNLVPATGKVKRALAAVAAAGLLMTAGGTVGLDALARRRTRRREESEPAGSPTPETPPAALVNGRELPAVPRPRERSALVVQRTAKVVKHPTTALSARPEAATYRSANARNEPDEDDTGDPATALDDESLAAAPDVRVVLQPQHSGGENGGESH